MPTSHHVPNKPVLPPEDMIAALLALTPRAQRKTLLAADGDQHVARAVFRALEGSPRLAMRNRKDAEFWLEGFVFTYGLSTGPSKPWRKAWAGLRWDTLLVGVNEGWPPARLAGVLRMGMSPQATRCLTEDGWDALTAFTEQSVSQAA